MFNLTNILINVPITLIALTGHEFAHGWVSSKLGDPTPKYEGRLTLNPLAHLDITGTILMILTGFGWAKPVGINPMYYKNKKKGMALTAIAGPIANLIMAFIGMLIGTVLYITGIKLGWNDTALRLINTITSLFAVRNLCFMIFNLIPIPPLDGSRVLGLLVSDRTYFSIMRYEQYSLYLIMALSLLGVFDAVIGTGVRTVYGAISYIIYAALSALV